MRFLALGFLAMTSLFTAGCFLAAESASAGEVELAKDEQKVLYTMGYAMSQSLFGLELEQADLDLIGAGMSDGARGREPRVKPEEFGPRITSLMAERKTNVATREKEAAKILIEKAAAEPGSVMADSGMVYLELKEGDGPTPAPGDKVTLHYHGTLRDGSVFDSSRDGEPATFPVGGVIGCFREGVQAMKVGGKGRITCPPSLAYGDAGSPPKILPGAAIIFELELLATAAATPAPAPTPSP